MSPVITTKELTRNFGQLTAVDSLTIEINTGEVVGFLGHNGAGKTTTVRLLNGLLAPTSGTIKVFGLDPIRDGTTLRTRTGVLTETPSLDEKLTARENLVIFGLLYNYTKREAEKRADVLLETFDLTHRADDRTGSFSKGMRQRLALARVLFHHPQLIFLDEPTSGLDPAATRQVHQTITQLSRDQTHTIFLCTHNLNEAQQLCDRVAVLEHGKLIAFGPPQELAANLVHGVKLEIEFVPHHAKHILMEVKSNLHHNCVVESTNVLAVWLSNRQEIPDVINTLVHYGLRIMRATPVEPTLEDVYFSLHGETSADNQTEPVK